MPWLPTPAGSALPWVDVAADFSVVLDELDTTLRSIEAVLDVNRLRRAVAELDQQPSPPDLWNDVEAAQALTSKLSYVQGDPRQIGRAHACTPFTQISSMP